MENRRSRAFPERLGFQERGNAAPGEMIGDRYLDAWVVERRRCLRVEAEVDVLAPFRGGLSHLLSIVGYRWQVSRVFPADRRATGRPKGALYARATRDSVPTEVIKTVDASLWPGSFGRPR